MTELAVWYPQAKFIVIWRDPADVCRSIVRAAEKSPWFARPGMDLRAILGYRRMKQEADALVRRGAGIHQLQYDDLVREPEEDSDCDLRLHRRPFDSRMTSLEGADRSAVYNGEHHSMVKSSSIVAKRERPEVLSPELKSKVERYVVFWRKQSGGSGPPRQRLQMARGRLPSSSAPRTVSTMELLRRFDLIVPFLYSFVPVSVWQSYRQVKSRYQRVAVKPSGSEAV